MTEIDDILSLDATAQAQLVRDGEIRAIELVEAFRRHSADRLSPEQQSELGEWLTWLDQQHGLVRGVLEPARVGTTPNPTLQKQINEALKKAGEKPKDSPK